MKKFILTFVLLASYFFAGAQYSIYEYVKNEDDSTEVAANDWYHLDFKRDNIVGVSSDKAYEELLANKKSTTVIVAIIDSGVDVDHEDLKDNIWVNKKEIAGNGIDDDKNGYVDDIHGWNFIGGADGKMVDKDNLELTRQYVRYEKLFAGKSKEQFKGKKLKEFEKYEKIKEDYEKQLEDANKMNELLQSFMASYNKADSIIKAALKKDEYTLEEVQKLDDEDENVKTAKSTFLLLKMMGITVESLKEGAEHYSDKLKYNLNKDFDPRKIVGDNYANKKEKKYGNNKVSGVNPSHGTHVAGIVGAKRNNGIGMNGIADNVKLMVIRTVPDGDERDKDVANAIYYAVKNGAKIINMSFGKDYSPYKKYVDKAVRYAEKKGVLLVHAAGNDGRNTDKDRNYPHPQYMKNGKWAKNWIEVGASSWNKDEDLAADFSNYGNKTVSLFAPGVEIYSTIPDNKYKKLQGTSMASPVVAGVAALVLSYYPHLKAEDLKKILIESSVKYKDQTVNIPGEKEKTGKFSKLSQSGGIVNAYNALKMAENYKKQ